MMPVTLNDLFIASSAFLVLIATLLVYKAIKGPTMQDRVLAVNVLGTKTVVILALLSAALNAPVFLDIALIYALLNFLTSIAISKFTVERGGVL